MKRVISIYFFLLLFLQLSAKSLIIDGLVYNVDTISNFKAGPGTQHIALKLTGESSLDVFFLKVDASNPYVSFKAALGLDSIYGRERPSTTAIRKSTIGATYFAGTNADFFDVENPPYYGYPLSGCVVEKEIARIPNNRRVIAFEEDKIPSIGLMTFTGTLKAGTQTFTINGVNHLRDADQLILYNRHNGKVTRTNNYGTEVLIKLKTGESWGVSKTITAVVQSVNINKGNLAIPKGYAVLSGHGTSATNLNSLSVNDEVQITLNMEMDGRKFDVSQMVGSDGRLPMLYEGKIETGTAVWNELHPRTAVGYSHDKKLVIFCVVDGRSTSSVGVTTKQLAQLMKSAGAYTAYNMDGGGSSAMYIKELGPVNNPSDGSERSVGNSLYAVSSAPANTTITEIQAYNPTIRIAKNATFKPKFIGYNQYGTLINKDLQGVVLSCSSDVGTITSNTTFKASGTKDGVITATYNGKITHLRVDQIGNDVSSLVERVSEDFSSPEWDAELKRLNPNYTTLLPGTDFQNMNSVDYYFDKYAFDGAMVSEPGTPNCGDSSITHGNATNAIAFRFRNSGTSFMEFPEMANAGTITVHVRNGNNTAATTLTLEQYVSGSWSLLNTFNLRAKNAYSATSVDEVLSYRIDSPTPVKLRLSRGDRFISLLRVDITAYGEDASAVPEVFVGKISISGNTVILNELEGKHLQVYNLSGMLVNEITLTQAHESIRLPHKGVYVLRLRDNQSAASTKVMIQ